MRNADCSSGSKNANKHIYLGGIDMKKIFGIMAAAAIAAATLTGCPDPRTVDFSGVDWKDYSDYSVKVKNSSSFSVVCFKGDPSAETLISGAKAGSTVGLKLDKKLFNSTSDFILSFVRLEDYETAIDLKSCPVMGRIYAYYNENSEARANLVYEISSKLGGDCYFQINNTTPYNCEIRKDGLYGVPFCYAGAQTLKTKVYADAGDYDFYPVFRKFDNNSGSILTSYPKTAKGNPAYLPVALDTKDTSILIDCKDFLSEGTGFTMSASACYVKVTNNSKAGVKLFQGATAVASVTDTGVATINSGKTTTFTIALDRVGTGEDGGYIYEEEKEIGEWKVGPEANRIAVPSITMKAGYRYELIVEGPSYDDLACHWKTVKVDGEEVPQEVKMDL